MHVGDPDHRARRDTVKYGLGWLIGIPLPIIALWFIANQAGCGL
jgi:hypothetical protein